MTTRRRMTAIGWLVIIALAALVATVVTRIATAPQPEPQPVLPAEGCRVTMDGFTTLLTWEQSENASIIVGESIRRGLPARAATIALVTAYQESDLRNLDYGDRDSVGLFQQRPSQGWGTVEQIMDPWYSAGKFYEHLVQVPDWETGVINDVAQAVQRSGFPNAYAQHESKGRAWASALTGHSPATVQCIDRSGAPANPAFITEFLARVFGEGLPVAVDGLGITIQGPGDPANWAIGHLTMLRGAAAGVVAVQVGEQQWVNSGTELAAWQPAAAVAAPVAVALRV